MRGWLTAKAKLTESGQITAVKVVELKEDELKETLLEMEILARCKHINITAFMGMYLKNLDLWVRWSCVFPLIGTDLHGIVWWRRDGFRLSRSQEAD